MAGPTAVVRHAATAPAGARPGAAIQLTDSARPARIRRAGSNRPRLRPTRRGTDRTDRAPRARPRPDRDAAGWRSGSCC
ncbi:hypothetical protein G6F59_016617 [Rhizopus arrhizus]|uniref:Uncharacterized protein n=1 Tax=Rhizopus delemar TaxID=936053 RepID=A0A9P6XNA1_9FUNG|nr:hypothetical protein G6F59_016617 [Rhizopus arrhizus]KAG1527889.1 hypothetical protein G6F50_018278 [Rhizopus delemar]